MAFSLAIIEDNEANRNMFTRILRSAKGKDDQLLFSEIVAFASIEELVAYQAAQPRFFDVYLTDNNLTDDGLTGLQFIPKQKEAHPACIMVLMSAVDIADQAKDAGADAFFRKGQPPQALIKLLSDLLATNAEDFPH